MTLQELLKILKTDYIEVAKSSDPYGSVEYLRRDELLNNPQLLKETVTGIEPLAALKKRLFESSSGESDYVASVKVLYGGDIEDEEEVVYSQEYEQDYEEEKSQSNPFFNFGNIGNMPMPDLEQMRTIINSDAFANFMESGIMDQILSNGMPDFSSGIDITDFLNNLKKDDDEDE